MDRTFRRAGPSNMKRDPLMQTQTNTTRATTGNDALAMGSNGSSEHDIGVLNDLIATTLDSADGYQEGIRDQEEGYYAPIFTKRAEERREVVAMLQAQVSALGGTPEDDGTALAGVHRLFTRLQAASTKGDEALINRIEGGEDHIKEKYETALADGEVSPQTIEVIREAYASVKSGHDEMSALKHSHAD